MKDTFYRGIQFFAEPEPEPKPNPDPAPNPEPEPAPEPPVDNSAELQRLKNALDKATKEAAEHKREAENYKKQVRAKQTEEEKRAEEEKEQREAMEAELNEFRKKATVAETAKRVLSFISDETVATKISEALYGAEDVDAAIDAIQKAWAEKEKKLRLEFGKIPAPGAGGNEPELTKEQFSKMTYRERNEIFVKHPALYQKLTS